MVNLLYLVAVLVIVYIVKSCDDHYSWADNFRKSIYVASSSLVRHVVLQEKPALFTRESSAELG